MKLKIIKIYTFILFVITTFAILSLDYNSVIYGKKTFWISILIVFVLILHSIFMVWYLREKIKNVIIFYLLFIFGLIIFYFTYFSTPLVKFNKIPDSYFDDKMYIKDFNSNDNAFLNIIKYLDSKEYKLDEKKIKELQKMSKYKDRDFSVYISKKYKNNLLLFENEKFDKYQLLILKIRRKVINKMLNSKYYIKDYKDYQDYTSRLELQTNVRLSVYLIMYYLKKGKEDIAVKYLIENYKLGLLLVNGYDSIADKLIGLNILKYTNKQILYIINNFKLKKENLDKLKDILAIKLDEDKIYKKTQIWEYNYNLIYFYAYLGRELMHNKNIRSIKDVENALKFKSFIFSSNENLLKEMIKNMHYYSFLKNETDKSFCRIIKKKNPKKIDYFLKKDGIKYVLGYIFCETVDEGRVGEIFMNAISSYKKKKSDLIKVLNEK